jgi:hypothetical protein
MATIWLSLEAHLTNFVITRIHPLCHFHRAVNDPGLRWRGSPSQVINQGQDFLEQRSWHGQIGQLESDITIMADNRGSDLQRLFP